MVLAIVQDGALGRLIDHHVDGIAVARIARDSDEGIELARSIRPNVILLDLAVPGAEGVKICQRLKSADVLREVPLIVLSATENGNALQRQMAAGAHAWLRKPLHPDELRAAVRAALRLGRVLDTVHARRHR